MKIMVTPASLEIVNQSEWWLSLRSK